MNNRQIRYACVLLLVIPVWSAGRGQAQTASTVKPESAATQPGTPLTPLEKQLLDRIDRLERRLAALEAREQGHSAAAAPAKSPRPGPVAGAPDTVASAAATPSTAIVPTSADPSHGGAGSAVSAALVPAPAAEASSTSALLPGETTLNFLFDGYYGYNFNDPVGRVNLLRAYDVLSNSFTLSQADMIAERAADPSAGRRYGYRLDLMFGQATETVQGGAQNESRPQVYRNIFQAYGTYVVPMGSGLTVDFGKFASSIGYEGNYVKDQINYSRSYFFSFLPFYHMGFRTKYQVNSHLALGYNVVNGAQQTEDFNGFKSQQFTVIVTPTKSVTWQTNYYVGREQRDLVPDLNPGIPRLPTQPGLSLTPIAPIRNGREHIFDSYISWQATHRLLFVGEGDYVLSRIFSSSTPAHVGGGAGYFSYQLTSPFSVGGRFEYLSDRGGLFSGSTQALKEGTLTATYQFQQNFQLRGEFRRDFSNQPFFLSSNPAVRERSQDTATLGLIWWFGGKQGPW